MVGRFIASPAKHSLSVQVIQESDQFFFPAAPAQVAWMYIRQLRSQLTENAAEEQAPAAPAAQQPSPRPGWLCVEGSLRFRFGAVTLGRPWRTAWPWTRPESASRNSKSKWRLGWLGFKAGGAVSARFGLTLASLADDVVAVLSLSDMGSNDVQFKRQPRNP